MSERSGPWRRRVSRRRFVKGTVLGGTGLVVAAAIGCAEKERQAVTSAPEQPKQGGVFLYGARSNYFLHGGEGFDPHTTTPTVGRMSGLFFQSLTGYDPRTYEAVPELARSWEQVDPTTYVFTLHPNVRFHNKPPVSGRAMTAEDVVWSLERARSPEPRFIQRTLLATADRIAALSPTTVQITLKQVDAAFLPKLGGGVLHVLPRESLERDEKLSSAESVAGTGAFIIKDAQPGVSAEFVRNRDYYKPGLPHLDGMVLPQFADEETAYAAFLAGRVMCAIIPGVEVENYRRRSPDRLSDWYPAAGGTLYGGYTPNTRVAPFTDPRVWKAFRLLIDHRAARAGFTESVYGRGVWGSLFSGTLDRWDLAPEEYERFPEWAPDRTPAITEARRLLAAAGYSPANSIAVEMILGDFPNNQILGPLYTDIWRRDSGGIIQVTLQYLPTAVLRTREGRGEFTLSMPGKGSSLHDPDAWLTTLYRFQGSNSFSGWRDEKAEALIEVQSRELNLERRRALVREILVYMVENSPFTAADKSYSIAGKDPRIRDWVPDTGGFLGRQYENVWLA